MESKSINNNNYILIFTILLFIVTAKNIQADTAVLTFDDNGSASGDTCVESDWPDGDNSGLAYWSNAISKTSSWTARVLLKASLSSIPAGSTINLATFYFYSAYQYSICTVTAVKIDTPWDSSSANWNHQPTYSSTIATVSVFTNYDHCYSMDFTNAVNNWFNGTWTNYGFALKCEYTSPIGASFYFSNDIFNYPDYPCIVVDYTPCSNPSQVSTPTPSDGAINIQTNQQLGWNAASGATSYDVYFGTPGNIQFKGNQGGTSYNPGSLYPSTTYNWRIDSKNSCGTTTGNTWSFTTICSAPIQVTGPNPSNDAKNIPINQQLSWDPAGGATSYDIYFGTSSNPPYNSNQSGISFNPGTLIAGTTYYWKIDSKNSCETTSGIIWHFSTNNNPVLFWTGEVNYTSDGLDYETGDISTIFTFRIKYADADNDAPTSDYPKIHIKRNNKEISGSPFHMTAADSNPYSSGRVYAYPTKLSAGNYTYYFEAKDVWGAVATGEPINQKAGPIVTGYIKGYVKDSFGQPISDTKIVISGDASGEYVTNGSGYYEILGLLSGKNYIVTPSKYAFRFDPSKREYSPFDIELSEQNFIIEKPTIASYPNPASINKGITFRYLMSSNASNVAIKIYNLSGELIKAIDNLPKTIGEQTYSCDGLAKDGGKMNPGVYIYVLEIDGKVVAKQVMQVVK